MLEFQIVMKALKSKEGTGTFTDVAGGVFMCGGNRRPLLKGHIWAETWMKYETRL